MTRLMTKAIVYKDMKRHGPIKKAIKQITSTRGSGFVAIAEYAETLHIRNGKTSMVDVFPRVVA